MQQPKKYKHQIKRSLVFVKYKEGKKCPICKRPLTYNKLENPKEWIMSCNFCRYRIRWILGLVELRVGRFNRTINPHNRKRIETYYNTLKAFGKAIKQERGRYKLFLKHHKEYNYEFRH